MELNSYYITTTSDFNTYIGLLEESARRGTVPDIFCIGLDLEYVNSKEFEKKGYKWEDLDWICNREVSCIPCILQMSTNEYCLVINLKEIGLPLPTKLSHILTCEAWIKMGVGISQDLTYLSQSYDLGNCSGALELKNLALLGHVKNPNLSNLYSFFFQELLRPKVESSCHNWLEPLTQDNFEYAALDAYMSFQIGQRILEPMIARFKSNQVTVISHNLQPDNNNENYVSRLNEIAQKFNYPYPTYITNKPNNTSVEVICQWPDLTPQIFSNININKRIAKQESAKQMLDFINKTYI